MKIAISAETTIDMGKDLLDKFDIKTVPFSVIMGSNEYLDGEITNREIFEFTQTSGVLPKTSAVNGEQYKEHFKNLLKDYDAVIHITLSSEMSSAYRNACEVANTLHNVYVVDSRSLSTGIALLAIKARNMANSGMIAERIVKELELLTSKVSASFILDKLDYLAKGGRCNALVAFGANLLSIKPQIIVSDGKMKVGKRYVGKYSKNIIKYCEDTLNSCVGYDTETAFVTYTTATPEEILTAKNALEARGFTNIYETTANGTISCHCGPKTLGILFIKA